MGENFYFPQSNAIYDFFSCSNQFSLKLIQGRLTYGHMFI